MRPSLIDTAGYPPQTVEKVERLLEHVLGPGCRRSNSRNREEESRYLRFHLHSLDVRCDLAAAFFSRASFSTFSAVRVNSSNVVSDAISCFEPSKKSGGRSPRRLLSSRIS